MKVAHVVRKRSQLDSSFIYNQILNHQDVIPSIFYGYDDKKTGMANFPESRFKIHNLKFGQNSLRKLLWFVFLKPGKTEIRQFKKHIEREKPDIIHLHYGSDAGLFLSLIKAFKIPSIVSFYGYDSSGFPNYFFSLGKVFLKRRVFKHATIITAMSEDMRNDILRLGCPSDKIIIHYHGINAKFFDQPRSYRSDTRVKFLIISSFTPQKGHIFLLKSFKEALKIVNNIELIIVGTGKEEQKVKNTISSEEINNVFLSGPVEYASAKHINFLKQADVFIHPSITDDRGNKEGIPGSIVEAMMSGLPIISTYHAGIPEVITNMGTGILVKENNERELTDAILLLARRADIRESLGNNAREYSLKNLDIKYRENNLENIYKTIISK